MSSKQKLSTVAVDNQPSIITRRTRSNSTADNTPQRSTRSANKNAFFELPHNYGSRKAVTESPEPTPLRRSKRSSTSSSSNHLPEDGLTPTKKRKLQTNEISSPKTVSIGKENLITCNGKADETENVKESSDSRKKNEIASDCNKNSSKEQNGTTVSAKRQDRNYSCNNEKEKLKNSVKADSIVTICSKSESTLQSYAAKNLPIPLCQLEDFKRKRHFSENEISASGRIRRLSERGEMASVMEFFFKNKKPLSNSFLSGKKSKLVVKRNLRNSEQKLNRTKLKDHLDCGVVARLKRTRNSSEHSVDSQTNSVLTKNLKNKIPHSTEENSVTSEESNMSPKNLPEFIKARINGVEDEKVISELLDEVSSAKKKEKRSRRSLRSSGVKFQPDYHALSLNLMLRRKSKISTENSEKLDLQVMSDSEVDLNKKSSIESCLADQEATKTQENQVTEDLSSMQFSITEKTEDIQSTVCRDAKCKKGRPSQSSVKQGLDASDLPEPPPLFLEEPPSGPEVYFFESDHMALKHNTDYYSLLRSASLLESQRKQAIADLDHLQKRLKKALQDPIRFVEQLQKKEDVDLPKDQTICALPDIDWSKYTSPFGTFENVFAREAATKPTTRGRKCALTSQKCEQPSTSNGDKTRSQTFRKSWSVEEQRKLEELLFKYPQEAVEFNRYRKIAAELEGRTALQVQSRVQKYFIKLAKAGLPIPGRMPKFDRFFSCKPRAVHRHRSHHQTALTRISTFFSKFHIPVKMSDTDTGEPSTDDNDGWDTIDSEQLSDEEDISEELRFSDEYLEILQLKRQRRQQLCMFDRNGRQAIARHVGYQCDICEREPIEGVRYHCIDCPESDAVDLCQSCIRMKTKFHTDLHKSNHRMEPVYASVEYEGGSNIDSIPSTSRPYADSDYTKVARSSGEYNYLDPNFLPPTG